MNVKDFRGEKVDRRLVRKIKGEFYKHEDLIIIGEQRYRCTSFKVYRRLDGELAETRRKDTDFPIVHNLTISKEGSILIEQLESRTRNRNIAFIEGYHKNDMKQVSITDAQREELVEEGFLRISAHGLAYYQNKNISDGLREVLQGASDRERGHMYKNLKYSIASVLPEYEGHKYTPKSNLRLDSEMEDLTFGVEFETSGGVVPHNKLSEMGIVPLRDGSISGYEYTTIPLTSIDHLHDVTVELFKKCHVRTSDAMHVHIGNVPHTPEFLEDMYKLSYTLQNELYEMVPSYKKKDTRGVKRRGENYTNPLPNATSVKQIINFLSDGAENGSDSITQRPHPSDPDGRRKWQIRSRYSSINFVNFIYSPSGTIEFRLHQGTVNPYKTIYWLLINAAIVKYAMDTSIVKTGRETLKDVIDAKLSLTTAAAINDYVRTQKEYFKAYSDDDPEYVREYKEDKSYRPRIKLWG